MRAHGTKRKEDALDTRALVNKYFESVNAGDWETWLSLFDDNVVMDEQLAGHVEGIDVLRGAVGALKKGYSRFKNYPIEVVVEGEKAMVVWRIEAANAKGVPINAKGVNFFRFSDGKITYMANFHDTVPFKPFTDQNLG
jgi:ketosteroid isomerase-like protein